MKKKGKFIEMGLEEISREDLLNLTGLPDDYELRPWPQFPSAEEVERILGRAAYARHTSEITANWRIIEERLKEQKVPPLIREIILKSCGQPFHFPVKIRIGDKTREGQDVGYRFDSQKYEGLQKEYKEKYDKIKEILEK